MVHCQITGYLGPFQEAQGKRYFLPKEVAPSA